MTNLSDIDIKPGNVALVNNDIIPQLAAIIPAGKKALDLYATKEVDEGVVAGIFFDLYVDLYSGDMMDPVADACDALLIEFEESIEEWAREKAVGLIGESDFADLQQEEDLWKKLIKGKVLKESEKKLSYAYFNIKEEDQLRKKLTDILDDKNIVRKVLAIWSKYRDYGDLIEELKSPILIRRKQLADVRSALKIKWKSSSYICPYEWRSVAQVMEALSWLKELKEGGYEVQMTWQHFYDFLYGYRRGRRTYTKSSIFGDGLLSDLEKPFMDEYSLLVRSWEALDDKVRTFNQEISGWKSPTNSKRPKSYEDLNEKVTDLYEHMQAKRKTFEDYLRTVTIIDELKRVIDEELGPQVERLRDEVKALQEGLQRTQNQNGNVQQQEEDQTNQSGT